MYCPLLSPFFCFVYFSYFFSQAYSFAILQNYINHKKSDKNEIKEAHVKKAINSQLMQKSGIRKVCLLFYFFFFLLFPSFSFFFFLFPSSNNRQQSRERKFVKVTEYKELDNDGEELDEGENKTGECDGGALIGKYNSLNFFNTFIYLYDLLISSKD